MFESLRKVYEGGIGAVVEHEIDPNVVWEQRVKDVEADQRNSYNCVITTSGHTLPSMRFQELLTMKELTTMKLETSTTNVDNTSQH
ncbi:hypothetical protein Fmac_004267 [Flemingia macrophylla]|uniref:Uncharacterized protein n=1 Tax=Flemingia macrophylla TaxID=520843 RepID=A0ABD1N4F9_9FABA